MGVTFLWIAAVGILLLMVAQLTGVVLEISRQVSYLKAEIRRADSQGERRHWERELKIYYLSLIPGISIKRAAKIVRRRRKKR